MIQAYFECIMPANEDDRLYLYIKTPNEYWYYFGYRQEKLEIASNHSRFNEEIASMKEKDMVYKMPDGGTYTIVQETPAKADAFVRRMKAAQKN